MVGVCRRLHRIRVMLGHGEGHRSRRQGDTTESLSIIMPRWLLGTLLTSHRSQVTGHRSQSSHGWIATGSMSIVASLMCNCETAPGSPSTGQTSAVVNWITSLWAGCLELSSLHRANKTEPLLLEMSRLTRTNGHETQLTRLTSSPAQWSKN